MKNLFTLCLLLLVLTGCEEEIYQPAYRTDDAVMLEPTPDLTDQFSQTASVQAIDFAGYTAPEAESILHGYFTQLGWSEADNISLDDREMDATGRLSPGVAAAATAEATLVDECTRCLADVEDIRVEQQEQSDRECVRLFTIITCCLDTDGGEDAMMFVVATRPGC